MTSDISGCELMALWNPPSDADLAVGKPAKSSHIRAIRDLPIALAERAPGAPWLNRIGRTITLESVFHDLFEPPWFGDYNLEGEWTVPDGVYRIEVTLVGGGGAGGRGVSYANTGYLPTGGGGGGAGAVTRKVLEVEPGQVFPVKYGAGGTPHEIHPSIDKSLDDFVIGDGGRTTFGTLVAAGGKVGKTPLGGPGGGATEAGFPTFYGARGGDSLQVDRFNLGHIRSGSGGASIFGGGAPGRYDVGEGYSSFVSKDISVYGAGGGGGHPEIGGPDTKIGGRGARGIVFVRY